MSAREATYEDAKRVFFAIDRDFKWHGWLLCIYGSVLSGKGRDIDLIAVPWREHADVNGALNDLKDRLKVKQEVGMYRGLMETESYQLLTEDNLLIDLQFRKQHA